MGSEIKNQTAPKAYVSAPSQACQKQAKVDKNYAH